MPRADCSSNTIRDSISRVAPSLRGPRFAPALRQARRPCALTRGRPAGAHSSLALGTLLAKLQVPPLIPREREVGMAVLSGRMSPRVPLDRCPLKPHFVWPGATRRCFDLLGAFPARRDDGLRGALGIGGGGRGGVRIVVGRVGWRCLCATDVLCL